MWELYWELHWELYWELYWREGAAGGELFFGFWAGKGKGKRQRLARRK